MFNQFDRLYAISDLHLGGVLGSQNFQEGELLAEAIKLFTKECPQKKIALVLNGDIIDFLAESSGEYLDTSENAVKKLEGIIKNPYYSPIFKSLKNFVHTNNRYLIFVLGNHDLELALPVVQNKILEVLCDEKDPVATRGKVTFIVDGTGYKCKVGNKSILCMHGEYADVFNVIDYNALRKVIRSIKLSQEPDEWIPNAGTQLIVDIMNDIKKKHAFIDLLKPDVKGAVPILIALDPEQLIKIAKLLGPLAKFVRDTLRLPFLGGDEKLPEPISYDDFSLQSITEKAFKGFDVNSKDIIEEKLLEITERNIQEGICPEDLIEEGEDLETLSVIGAIKAFFRREKPSVILGEVLENWLKSYVSTAFNINAEDKNFRWIEENVGSDVHAVICGHTHLRRAIKCINSNSVYFNPGSWINFIVFDKNIINDKKELGKKIEMLEKEASVEKLKQAKLISNMPTVVSIWKDYSNTVYGDLRDVKVEGNKIKLETVKDSMYQI